MRKTAFIFAAAVLLIIQAPAEAQLSNMLGGAMRSGSSGGSGLSGLTGMSVPSVGSASPTNLAGLLQYCVRNNYLGGANADTASSVKDSLLSKFTGSSSDPSSNTGFSSGANGLLNTGNGQNVSLGGGGIKQQITQKVCAQVLQHGQSLL